MKILLVAPSFPPKTGGIENLMKDIASRSTHDITVLTDENEDADDSGYDFDIIRKSFPGYLGFLRKSYFLMKKSGEFDKIYLSGSSTSWTTVPSSLMGTDIVSHAHGRELFIDIKRLRTYLRKILFFAGLRSIGRFIAVSDWTASRLEELGVKKSNIDVVPNGIDSERFSNPDSLERSELGIEENNFVLLTVSRLDPRKGHDLVMEAMKNIDNCKYVIVGDGSEKSYLKMKARELNIEDDVIFAGYVEDEKLPSYYGMADLFVMPSKHLEDGNVEGFGITYIEANAAGLPVIGSKTGGIPTAVNDGFNGILCDPRHKSVEKAIAELKEDDSLREEMSENAIEWAEKHDWKNVIERIDRVLEK